MAITGLNPALQKISFQGVQKCTGPGLRVAKLFASAGSVENLATWINFSLLGLFLIIRRLFGSEIQRLKALLTTSETPFQVENRENKNRENLKIWGTLIQITLLCKIQVGAELGKVSQCSSSPWCQMVVSSTTASILHTSTTNSTVQVV